MPKLNQVIAVEKGIKSRIYSAITDIYKAVQKPELFSGFIKSYQAKDDADDRLPSESKRIQFVARDVLRNIERLNTELMDVTARKDWTNCIARAAVAVDGKEIIPAAPVSYLLFLEKQLKDFHAIAIAMPVLDDAEDWVKDENSGLMKTKGTETHRTKKVPKVVTLVQPTVEHPGQAVMVQEDIIAGLWTQVKMSGAMAKPEKQALVERVETLQRAIKEARETANMEDVVQTPAIGSAVFGYLLGGI